MPGGVKERGLLRHRGSPRGRIRSNRGRRGPVAIALTAFAALCFAVDTRDRTHARTTVACLGAMSNVGRMDGAFFVSRTELLSWANGAFDLSLAKVEQCANGAVYCQIIDACHPGSVQMKKVNWMARDEHQCLPNYKVLQQAFDKIGIQRHIDVDKLVRGKYQDNLEMLQWIKTYFDRTYAGDGYDAPSRRFSPVLPEWASGGAGDGGSGGPRPSTGNSVSRPASGTRPHVPSRPTPSRTPGNMSGGVGNRGVVAELEGLRDEHERLRDEVVDLKITVDGLETERDFYFQKLRDIEILCQALEAHPDPNMTVGKFVDNVQRILYAKDEDDEEALVDGYPG